MPHFETVVIATQPVNRISRATKAETAEKNLLSFFGTLYSHQEAMA
jgi:hypothetical protein